MKSVSGDRIVVTIGPSEQTWAVAECRLDVPARGVRPRPGWQQAWVLALDRPTDLAVERSGVLIRRTTEDLDRVPDQFLVIDERDGDPHVVGPRDGYASIDEAFGEADKVVRSAHPDAVDDVYAKPYVDSTGDDALRVIVVLRDRVDGRPYTHEDLRPIHRTVRDLADDGHRIVYPTFLLRSEVDEVDEADEADGIATPL
ncbi:MAG: hypothetical protein ABMB14_37430 [Myxococcota bacterium]